MVECGGNLNVISLVLHLKTSESIGFHIVASKYRIYEGYYVRYMKVSATDIEF